MAKVVKRIFNKQYSLEKALVELKGYPPELACRLNDDLPDLIKYILLSGDKLNIGSLQICRKELANGNHKPGAVFDASMHETIRLMTPKQT